MLFASGNPFYDKAYIAEVLNRYTGEKDGEAENKETTSIILVSYKSSKTEAAKSRSWLFICPSVIILNFSTASLSKFFKC